jgi:hypothetical protein
MTSSITHVSELSQQLDESLTITQAGIFNVNTDKQLSKVVL